MNTSFEAINSTHRIGLNISPNEGDLAIVSIDNAGTPGLLNSLILKEYGYSEKDLPNRERLVHGFSQIPAERRKAILFVVTVNGGETRKNLEKNLYNVLVEFRGWFSRKKLWIPLMGTGVGGLSLDESYSITVNVINRFQQQFPTETNILISIPDSEEGKKLHQKITSQSYTDKTTIEDAEIFIKSLDVKFYLAGSIWGKEDQFTRFLKEGIWEKGHEDESYSSLILQVKKNDILIIKSTYASDSISYLRVKAFGIVTANSDDGTSISVDWKIKDLSIDVEHLGFYRNTIQEVSISDVTIILSKVDRNRWNDLRPLTPQKKETIAGLISDSDKGVDYLEITRDVNAFARVVSAKSFEPPLAIALFGKWGSGKSFFMRKLKEQIVRLSINKSGGGIYCEGIAHIHFNAWSYMDSNLWASIVTKIFEELNEYISENKKENVEKKEIEKQLTNQLSITKEEIGILEHKKNSVHKQIETLRHKRKSISGELDQKIKKVKTDTVWKIIENADSEFKAKEKIVEALNDNESYLKTQDDLKKIIPEKYWNNPEKTYQLAKSRITFLKEFFRKDKIQTNLIWLAVILLIILCVPLILELLSFHISKTNFLIPQAVLSMLVTGGAIWRRAETVYNQLQPIVSSFWKIKEAHEQQINEAVSKFEQEEKALKLEIEKGKSEVLLISEQIQKAESIKTDLEFRINNALTTETLYSFIDRRSNSEDYKKHLGIISTIRRDFEILNNLFTGHNQEVEKIRNAEEFKRNFKKPLERIILYVDDLDRCPEENVVQVLEAVNLLMAFPLFVVIVGVDSRWVKNALIKKHALQFTGKFNGNDSSDSELEIIEPSNYLEKIFQVPFHLKDAKDISVKEMIKKLAQSKAQITETSKGNYDEDVYVEKGYVEEKDDDPKKEKANSTINTDTATDTILVAKPEALILTDVEIALMQDMSEVIGNNPRAVKRFINIFRIIKAHEEFSYSSDTNNQELTAILFLLALPLGDYKKLLPSFEEYIQEESNSTKLLTLYLQPIHKVAELDNLKHNLNVTLSDKQSFRVLQNIPVAIFRTHNSFIRRFTFKQL